MTPRIVEPVPVVDDMFEQLGVRVITHGCVAEAAFVEVLTDDERQMIDRAVDVRRHEFAGGRACAHASLDALEVEHGPILNRADRSPIWPRSAVGSISHSEGYCLASASRETQVSIGVDAEVVGRVTEEISRVTMSDGERGWIASTDRPDVATTAVFAVKEALYKAQHPLTGSWLDFGDVEVSPTSESTVLRAGLVGDVPAVRRLTWPLTARWTLIEPVPGIRMTVAAVVARTAGSP